MFINLINNIVGKKHDTFPEEQPEMPVPEENPEVSEPSDPSAPEFPQEDPTGVPDELPHPNNHPEHPDLI